MPSIVFLPHPEICPAGVVIEAAAGESICDIALEHGIQI